MNNFYALFLLSVFIPTVAMITIEPYQAKRDSDAIEKILRDYPQELTYEALGKPEGTTKKFIESKNYTTKVLLVDNKPVGFVNYAAFDVNFCTFHIHRQGLIHLIGVDTEYQNKGYGEQLLDHAMSSLEKEEVSTIGLQVRKDNEKATRLYTKKGFVCLLPSAIPTNRLTHVQFNYNTNISINYALRGNIIQQHPKISLAIGLLSTWALYNQYTS